MVRGGWGGGGGVVPGRDAGGGWWRTPLPPSHQPPQNVDLSKLSGRFAKMFQQACKMSKLQMQTYFGIQLAPRLQQLSNNTCPS